jgi:hypothetical protein
MCTADANASLRTVRLHGAPETAQSETRSVHSTVVVARMISRTMDVIHVITHASSTMVTVTTRNSWLSTHNVASSFAA